MVSVDGPMTGRPKNMAEHLATSVQTVPPNKLLSAQRYLHSARMLLHQASYERKKGEWAPLVDVSSDHRAATQALFHVYRPQGMSGWAERNNNT